MKKVLLASSNQGKLKELRSYLSELPIELISQPTDARYEVAETGTTFVENAIIKARHSAAISKLPCIADDSGLVVDTLDGKPGVKTARFAHNSANSLENMDYLLEKLMNQDNRVAKFICVLVYLRHEFDPSPIIVSGEWNGVIAEQKSGNNGFGYDPIFIGEGQNKSNAELSPQEKAKYSHRGKASRSLSKKLGELWVK